MVIHNSDSDTVDLLKSELERLRNELKENETLINDLKENESIYLSEIKDLKNTLRKGLDLSKEMEEDESRSLFENNENCLSETADFYVNTDDQNKTDLEKEILFNIDLEIVELSNELNKSTVKSVLGGGGGASGDMVVVGGGGDNDNSKEDSIFRQKYLELFEAIESMTHPAFVELQNELNRQFYEEYEELKNECARKLECELQTYKVKF
jgi:hypothetical protein